MTPHKKRHTEALLNLLNLPTDRRLRQKKLIRRERETQAPRRRLKAAQQVKPGSSAREMPLAVTAFFSGFAFAACMPVIPNERLSYMEALSIFIPTPHAKDAT